MLENYLKNSTPVTCKIDNDEEKQALSTCEAYLNGIIKDTTSMTSLTLYYIISKLTPKKQIEFIKENIQVIEEKDEEIFLYTMLCPHSLSYFLSYPVIKELKNISPKIFHKIISKSSENLFYGFTPNDYTDFFNDFYEDIAVADSRILIEGLYFQSHCYFEQYRINNLNDNLREQKQETVKFINFILAKYKEKISTFSPDELLRFIKNITDISAYKAVIQEHHNNLNLALKDTPASTLAEYLSETSEEKQAILFQEFSSSIITKQNIKNLIFKIFPSIILNLYQSNPSLFSSFTLLDWIKICTEKKIFNKDFQNILDTFPIDNLENIFDSNYFLSRWYQKDTTALKYIELKYRQALLPSGIIEPLTQTSSLFSSSFIKNLTELKNQLKNNTITRRNPIYKEHLLFFILYLKSRNIVTSMEGPNFQEIEKLFYRIVMGASLSILYQITTIEEITLTNRLQSLEFNANEFTVEQIQNYNVKHHKMLYLRINTNYDQKNVKKLTLKLLLLVGFDHAKKILELENSLTTLEHLVGNVDVKNRKLDNAGNPILNPKQMNLLFSTKDSAKIKEMLQNKDGDLYKYFPRILNEWEIIEMSKKTTSLKTCIEFLKSDEIIVPPKYYRLDGLFKYIGCKNSIVTDALWLHDQMLKRTTCTIPTLSGKKDDYTYEILSSSNMESLTAGNITNCCFTIQGVGYACLKHAVTSQNGRLLVIKKDGHLIAHSWIWRNGNLLCFDNIEISKSMEYINFLNVYLQIADELLEISTATEDPQTCLKNITIGRNNYDKYTTEINQFPCFVSAETRKRKDAIMTKLGPNQIVMPILPQPLEDVTYSDSKSVQYLIRGNGNFKLGQSPYLYEEERNEVMHYIKGTAYPKEYLTTMNKKINALRYIKAEQENTLDTFESIDIQDFSEAYCNDDWYSIRTKENTSEQYIHSAYPNVQSEMPELNPKRKMKRISEYLE